MSEIKCKFCIPFRNYFCPSWMPRVRTQHDIKRSLQCIHYHYRFCETEFQYSSSEMRFSESGQNFFLKCPLLVNLRSCFSTHNVSKSGAVNSCYYNQRVDFLTKKWALWFLSTKSCSVFTKKYHFRQFLTTWNRLQSQCFQHTNEKSKNASFVSWRELLKCLWWFLSFLLSKGSGANSHFATRHLQKSVNLASYIWKTASVFRLLRLFPLQFPPLSNFVIFLIDWNPVDFKELFID